MKFTDFTIWLFALCWGLESFNLMIMVEGSFKERFKALSWKKKLVLFASFALVISSFLPWYQDIDKFKTGDSFLGITGPLYLGGILVLLGGGVVFANLVMYLLGREMRRMPMKKPNLYMAVGGFSVLILVLASSVYFHPKFGVNLTDKTMGIGMMIAFVASGLLILGGFLNSKEKKVIEGHTGLDDFVSGDERPVGNIEQKEPVAEQPVEAEPQQVKPLQDAAYKAYQDLLNEKRTVGDAMTRHNQISNNQNNG